MAKLRNKRVLITSGPTRALIDRVRYITNRSTGRLGAAIGEAVLGEGAGVSFIRGEGSYAPRGVGKLSALEVHSVETVSGLARLLEELREQSFDVIIHAMAVLDYEPESFVDDKVRSGREEWVVRLKRTPKIISRMRRYWPSAVLVGFKLEVGVTEEHLERLGKRFLKKAKCDVVVANDLEREL